MFVDARPFKAKHSAAFLSKQYHEKIATKRQIARAYLAGADLKELAEEYGLSIQKIMAIANWYDREKLTAKRLAGAAKAEPDQAEPIPPSQALEDTQRPGTYVIEMPVACGMTGVRYQPITLPLLSIQKRKFAE